MNTTAATTNPMMLGIDEMPRTTMPRGIQNHTTASAPPVISEAVGTTPIGRGRRWGSPAEMPMVSVSAAGASGAAASFVTTMPTNLWTGARRGHGVFPRVRRGFSSTAPCGASVSVPARHAASNRHFAHARRWPY